MADKTEVIYDLIFNTQAASRDIQSLNVQLKTIQDNMTRVGGAGRSAGESIARTGRAFGGAGQSIQNASFQVADFAVQVSSGTSATRALSQQLPQLLGGFGAFGAVAGAAVAILVPLGSALLSVRDYAAITSKSIDAMSAALETAKTPLADLTEKYGNLATQIRSVAQGMAEMDAARATRSVVEGAQSALDAGAGSTFSVRFLDAMKQSWVELSAVATIAGTEIAGALGNTELYSENENKLSKFRMAFGLSAEAASQFGAQYLSIQEKLKASKFDEAATQISNFKSDVAKASDAIQDQMGPVLDAFLKQLQAVGQAAVTSGQKINKLASQGGMSFTPNNGANGFNNSTGNSAVAQQLADMEKRAADAKKATAAAAAAAAAAQAKQTAEYERFIGTIERGVGPLQRTQEVLRQAQESFMMFQAQMSPEQVANYSAYIEDLNKKIADLTFKDRWDEMAKGIESISTPLSQLYESISEVGKAVQESFAGGLTDAFMSFIEGTKSAQEAMKQFAVSFLKEITAMIIKSLILYVIQSALGMAGGSNAFGALTQQFGGVYGRGGAFRGGRELKAFANGGVVNSPTYFPMAGGQTGLMGEAGPEAIVPLTRRNGKLGVEASPVNVTVINNSSASVSAKRTSDGGVSIEVVEETVANLIARGGNKIDNAMARGYGLRRAGR